METFLIFLINSSLQIFKNSSLSSLYDAKCILSRTNVNVLVIFVYWHAKKTYQFCDETLWMTFAFEYPNCCVFSVIFCFSAEMDHYMSVPNLSNTESAWMSDQSTIKSSPNTTYVNVPPRGDSRKKRGFFSFLRKDKRGKSVSNLISLLFNILFLSLLCYFYSSQEQDKCVSAILRFVIKSAALYYMVMG